MCDFLSSVCRIDGAIIHKPHNGHSQMVQEADWTENGKMADFHAARFVECEWSGEGKYPGADKIARGPINEKQRRSIDGIYQALGKLISNPGRHSKRMLFGKGIFAGDDYADIRWLVLIRGKISPKLSRAIGATKLAQWDGSPTPINPLPSSITTVGDLYNLRDYAHPLPASITTVGYLYLQGYAHPLPASITTTGDLYNLRDYAHPLPSSITTVGNLDLRGYAHPLPSSITTVGNLYLQGYAHPLPASITTTGEIYR